MGIGSRNEMVSYRGCRNSSDARNQSNDGLPAQRYPSPPPPSLWHVCTLPAGTRAASDSSKLCFSAGRGLPLSISLSLPPSLPLALPFSLRVSLRVSLRFSRSRHAHTSPDATRTLLGPRASRVGTGGQGCAGAANGRRTGPVLQPHPALAASHPGVGETQMVHDLATGGGVSCSLQPWHSSREADARRLQQPSTARLGCLPPC